MGSLFGGGSQTTNTNSNSTQTSAPAGLSVGAITTQDQDAYNLLQRQQQGGPFGGPLYAPTNAGQYAAAGQATNFGTGAGATLANTGASSLTGLFGNEGAYSNNAMGMAANGVAGPNAGLMGALDGYGTGATTPSLVSSPLSSALQNAGVAGANTLGSATANLGALANSAQTDATGRITSDAGQYMDSAPIQSAIASTNAGIASTLNETTLPGINQAAAMGGSLNSSRAGAANAEAQGQAALAEGNADASIENNAFNTGAGTAAGLYSSGLNTALGATGDQATTGLNSALGTANLQNNEGQFTTSNQLSAANSGLANQQAFEGLNANTQLTANSQLGQGIFDASLGTNNVENAASNNENLAGAAGNLQQQNQQAQDTANLDQFQNNQTYNQGILQNYANLVDNPNYQTTNGSTTGTSTQANSGPGLFGGLVGTAAGVGGLLTGNWSSGLANASNNLGMIGGLFGGGSNTAANSNNMLSLLAAQGQY